MPFHICPEEIAFVMRVLSMLGPIGLALRAKVSKWGHQKCDHDHKEEEK